jgi:hypothetical protein
MVLWLQHMPLQLTSKLIRQPNSPTMHDAKVAIMAPLLACTQAR